MAVATVSYRAELADLTAKLSSIPGITAAEAKKTAAALDKSLRAVEASTKRATTTTKAATVATGNLGRVMQSTAQQMPDVATQLAAGTSAMQVMVQQGLQVVQSNMAAFTSAAAAAAPVLGVLTVAVVAGSTAWLAMTDAQRDANAVSALTIEVQRSMQPILADTRRKVIDLAEATGELTAAEAAHNRAALEGLTRWQAATSASAAKAAELRVESESLTTQVVDFALAVSGAVPTGFVMHTMLDALTDSSEELLTQSEALTASVRGSLPQMAENVAVTEKLAVARKRASTSTASLNDEEERAARQRAAMIAEVTANADAQVAAIHRVAAEKAKAAAASAAITKAAYIEAGQEREAIAARAEAQIAGLSSVANAASSAAADFAAILADKHRGAAIALVAVSKGAGAAEAIISGHIAAMKAFALYGPTPFGFAAAGLMEAAGVASAAKIVATPVEFHGGRAYDEIPATVLRSERVLTATGARQMGGDRAIADANRGKAPSGGGVVSAAFILGHQVFDKQTRTALRLPNSSLASALARGRTVGHR